MFQFDLNGKNKYYNLYLGIRDEILSGKVKAGQKLPSKRALAEELGVSVVTVQLSYEQLLAEGFIRSKERSGYFAEEVEPAYPALPAKTSERKAEVAEEKYKVDFVKGSTPAALFPFATWAKLTRTVLADCGEHLLERVPCDGDGELKEQIAAYLYRSRGIYVDPQYVVVGAGAEHLYGVIVQLLGSGAAVAVENPGYGTISSTYALYGASIVPVKVIDSGICLNECEKSDVTAVHVSPAHQFPTGAVMPATARSRLISWACAKSGRYIIEDDYDSEFRLTGKPLQSMLALNAQKVVYVNTFSKSLAPSMRLSYAVLPPELYKKYRELFSSNASIVPLFEQKTLAAMLKGGYFERHLSRLKNYYRGVRKAVLKKLSEIDGCEVADTGSGLHVVAKFAAAPSDEFIKQMAAKAGIKLKCLTDYLISPCEGYERCAVINYSGVTAEQVEKYCNNFTEQN